LDGNETWLVVTAVILWGAFPVAYATLISAFYLPLLVMLAGLILRGVAFEYRHNTERMRWIWDLSFVGGSLAATFIQGLTVGALVEGLPMANGQYAGGDFGLVQSIRGTLRCRTLSGLCTSRHLLAGPEMQGRRA
jgi:cytochrome d ubiquinol oxidase subunit II